MKKTLFLAGAVALAMAAGPTLASAQSMQASEKAGVSANANVNNKANVRAKTKLTTKTSAHISGTRSLARADEVAGTHGAKGRANARLHGSHRTNFCPPGQAKKPGLGSRFQC